MTDWTRPIRDVADFPKPGIVFKDIMPMLADPVAFAAAIEAMAAPWRDTPIDAEAHWAPDPDRIDEVADQIKAAAKSAAG